MTGYLKRSFEIDNEQFVTAYDELPLWSAPFGLLLLEKLKLRPRMRVLDVGCGTGFPALELAQRLGETSVVYGLDPWRAALKRLTKKAQNYGVKNIRPIEGDAAVMSFSDGSFDLVVSNLGINNFDKPEDVLREVYRVLKPAGQVALTSNFKGHMDELYTIFKSTLRELGLDMLLEPLQRHIDHRSDLDSLCSRLQKTGFTVTDRQKSSFRLRFLDGSSVFRHYFIQLGFLAGWKQVVPEELQISVFNQLERNLNDYAARNGELALSIPFGYVEGTK